MIALDTSAILAIVSEEPEAKIFAKIIAETDCVIGAPTCLEALIVVRGRANPAQLQQLQNILANKNVVTVGFGPEHVATAEAAFERFGKGMQHPARLNFGDCMAYAVARMAQAPLLFKGDDFTRTDVASAIPS